MEIYKNGNYGMGSMVLSVAGIYDGIQAAEPDYEFIEGIQFAVFDREQAKSYVSLYTGLVGEIYDHHILTIGKCQDSVNGLHSEIEEMVRKATGLNERIIRDDQETTKLLEIIFAQEGTVPIAR